MTNTPTVTENKPLVGDTVAIKVEMPSGVRKAFAGRKAWALGHLLDAGQSGITTIDHPAPRWSHYIFQLRRDGIHIHTQEERHGGTFAGRHGRFRLVSSLTVLDREVA